MLRDLHKTIRGIAGTIILVSLILAISQSKLWLLITAFVGANLLQSAFTNNCPMMGLLKKLGFK